MIERLKKLTSDSIIYGLGGAIGTFIGVFLTPILTRILTPADYGVIDITNSLTNILLIFVVAGLDSAMIVHFFETEDAKQKKSILTTAFMFMVGISVVMSVLAIIFAKPIAGLVFGSNDFTAVIKINFVTLPFSLIILASLVVLRLGFRPWRYTIINILKLTLTIGLTIFFVVGMRASLPGYFYAILAANIFAAFICLYFIRTSVGISGSRTQLRSMLRYGLPLIPAGIADFTLNLLDRFFLVHYRDLNEVGLYAVGIKVGSVILLLVNAFQLAWGPYAYSIAKQPDAKPFYAKILNYYMLLTCGIGVVISIFAKPILHLLTAPAFINGYRVVIPIAFGLIIYGAYYIVTVGIAITHNTKHTAWTTVTAAVLNVILNFALIPRYGMVGAAFATMFSYVVFTYLVYRMSQRYFHIPYRIQSVAWLLLGSYIAASIGQYEMSHRLVVDLSIKTGVIIVYAAVVWWSGFIDATEKQFLKAGVRKILRRPPPTPMATS